jgi:hypothetical protein
MRKLTHSHPVRRAAIATALVVMALVISGASSALAHGSTAYLRVAVTTHHIGMPAKVQAGWYRLDFVNQTGAPDEVTLLRFRGHHTLAELLAAAKNFDIEKMNQVAEFRGGDNQIVAGARQSIYTHFAIGRYVAVDTTTNVIQQFTVVGPDFDGSAPEAAGTVKLSNANRDFDITLPRTTFPDGSVILRVANTGTEVHEFAILRLANGVSQSKVEACLRDPNCTGQGPVTPAGGLAALSPGDRGYVEMHFAPGHYVAVCFMPDPAKNEPHAMLAMYAFFHVSEDVVARE